MTLKSRARQRLGPLGRWAAGGGGGAAKTPEERVEEVMQNTIKIHREGVIWYLQQNLQDCSNFQSTMMEIRLSREIEKSKSALHKARDSVTFPSLMDEKSSGLEDSKHLGNFSSGQQEISPEQMQVLKQENRDLLKHYEDTLDQVRYVIMIFDGKESSKIKQVYRAVVDGDFRTPDNFSCESIHTVFKYRTSCGRFVPHHRER